MLKRRALDGCDVAGKIALRAVSFAGAVETPLQRHDLGFSARSENFLASLDDDGLIEHIRQARTAGETDQIKLAISILAHKRFGDVFARIRLRFSGASIPDAEDIAMTVMEHACKASFDGDHVGQFVNMLHTITDRRIADFLDRKRLDTDPLEAENLDDENVYGSQLGSEDFSEALASQKVYEAALGELSEKHRLTVTLTVAGFAASEVADRVNEDHPDEVPPMTAPNVHQIMKRFRDQLAPQIKAVD